jgi:hypothetical protein
VTTGSVACWRCGELIAPWDDWDLDHSDGALMNGAYRGAAHASCNRAAGAEKANREVPGVDVPERGIFWRSDGEGGWARVSRRW